MSVPVNEFSEPAPLRSNINELAAALAKAQGRMANAVMNRTNPHFKSRYADLSSVLDAIREPLSAAGLSVVQTMHFTEGGMMVLRTTLMHSSGQSIFTEYPLPPTQKPHEIGSALTYARRYSLAALVCNSADEDDDGNSAMAAKPAPATNAEVLTPDELLDIRAMGDAAGKDEKLVAQSYAVQRLEDIPSAKYQSVKKRLQISIDANSQMGT
jgi:hypothetical protein